MPFRYKLLCLPAIFLLVAAHSRVTPPQAAQPAAKVSGRVTSGEGQPVPGVKVEYTDPASQRSYTMTTGLNGEFTGSGVIHGTYRVTVSRPNSEQTFSISGIVVSANEQANVLNIDLARLPQEPARLTPEQIDDIKAQNARARKINAVIIQVNAALQAGKWGEVETGARQLLEMDSGNYRFYGMLGSALFNLERCEQAVSILDKGILAAREVTTPEEAAAQARESMALMLTTQGNCYVKLEKSQEAITAFSRAAALDPHPGVVNFNLCATSYNRMVYETKKAPDPESLTAALAACDHALEAEPTRAVAYFMKASLLIARTLNREGNVTVNADAISALKKYLELAPEGPDAEKAKALLAAAGER